MNPLPSETTFLMIWLLGVSLGLTACTATCLPFMGTWILGRGTSHRQAWFDTGGFVAGRMVAYSLLGGLAGGAGKWLSSALQSGMGNTIIGLASMIAGVWLAWAGKSHAPCGAARSSSPPFVLGFSLSLTPCAPLASLLAVCAAAGSVPLGMSHGIAFGLGAALTPLLILLPLINLLGRNLRENRAWMNQWIRWGAAGVLILLGLRRLLLG
ncbi:MAG: sulfite exporter TauE/SafE family protein [Gallionella sp.]